MAEAFVVRLASELLSKILSLAAEELIHAWGFEENLEALRERLELVDALLSDADIKQVTMNTVQVWLNRLKDISRVADALMDKLAYEVIRQKIEKPKDKDEVQHQISILLFIGLSCGVLMFLFTRLLGAWALTAFTGAKNLDIISAANTYVQIRSLAWPAVLIGWVTPSASLGMKDSWGPLKALAVASALNGIGAVVLCTFLGYGIAGAAWATMASQVVAAYMMVEALNKKGYNGFALSVPSSSELKHIFTLAAPVFITMMSKVAFYSLLVYFATSMGIQTVAAHQARMLLKSLIITGALCGIILGSIGTSVPWSRAFSPDAAIIKEMHQVLIPYFITPSVTPSTSGLEGALLAVRDLKFISLSMSGIVSFGALRLLFLTRRGNGFPVCWWALATFQWSRFSVALIRLTLTDGILYSDKLMYSEVGKQKTA